MIISIPVMLLLCSACNGRPRIVLGVANVRLHLPVISVYNSCLFSLPNNESLIIIIQTVHVSPGLAMLTAALQLSFAST
jgi:hypothetical protein